MDASIRSICTQVRRDIVNMTADAGCGHPGGSLSIVEALVALYFEKMRIDPQNPKWEDRDRFVLSKGHTAPALYAVLAEKGYFDKSELKTLRQADSFLQGHPDMKGTPGVDMTTGSLGLGISAACGMALAGKISGKDYRVYTILGDGETEEGQVWEASMFANHYKLDNLCVIIDWNGLQIDGRIVDVMNPTPYDKKLEAFGYNVVTVDAHDFDSIAAGLAAARACKGRPTAIIAVSTKGKGVSFMENQASWHGSAPDDAQYEQAVAEIKASL